MSEFYNAKVIASSRELTAKEQIRIKSQPTVKLDEVVGTDGTFFVTEMVTGYVLLGVHNEKAQGEKDYQTLLVEVEGGKYYSTGSKAFIESFMEIFNELAGAEEFSLEVYRVESRNFKGKTFLKCIPV